MNTDQLKVYSEIAQNTVPFTMFEAILTYRNHQCIRLRVAPISVVKCSSSPDVDTGFHKITYIDATGCACYGFLEHFYPTSVMAVEDNQHNVKPLPASA